MILDLIKWSISYCYFVIYLVQVIFFLLRILRDGHWSEQDAAILVPGDIINIKLGDIIPADACLLEDNLLIKKDEIEAVVMATGLHTSFGIAAYLVDSTNQVGHF
ncbi:hypothetical protein AHAS_Ahas06G0149300 [Arachis hypogaea]